MICRVSSQIDTTTPLELSLPLGLDGPDAFRRVWIRDTSLSRIQGEAPKRSAYAPHDPHIRWHATGKTESQVSCLLEPTVIQENRRTGLQAVFCVA